MVRPMLGARIVRCGCAALLAVALVGSSVRGPSGLRAADVDLSYEPALQSVQVGDPVSIQIRATSAGGLGQEFGVIDAIVSWDPAVLQFMGIDGSADCCEWFLSAFLNDPDGINLDLNDGTVLYTAAAELGSAAVAELAPGSVITTLTFQALTASPGTVVSYTPMVGSFGLTRVLATTPGVDLTGDVSATATVQVGVLPAGVFVRGDANADGSINIADPVWILSYLFAMGAPSACADSADGNDDGSLDIADPVAILGHLFAMQGPLPAPHPACGTDPTADPIGCSAFAPCP